MLPPGTFSVINNLYPCRKDASEKGSPKAGVAGSNPAWGTGIRAGQGMFLGAASRVCIPAASNPEPLAARRWSAETLLAACRRLEPVQGGNGAVFTSAGSDCTSTRPSRLRRPAAILGHLSRLFPALGEDRLDGVPHAPGGVESSAHMTDLTTIWVAVSGAVTGPQELVQR
jgi:hypothetical protein